jgi:hypothetical protein
MIAVAMNKWIAFLNIDFSLYHHFKSWLNSIFKSRFILADALEAEVSATVRILGSGYLDGQCGENPDLPVRIIDRAEAVW